MTVYNFYEILLVHSYFFEYVSTPILCKILPPHLRTGVLCYTKQVYVGYVAARTCCDVRSIMCDRKFMEFGSPYHSPAWALLAPRLWATPPSTAGVVRLRVGCPFPRGVQQQGANTTFKCNERRIAAIPQTCPVGPDKPNIWVSGLDWH